MKLEDPIWFDTPPKDKSAGAKKQRSSSSRESGGRSSQVPSLPVTCSHVHVSALVVNRFEKVRCKGVDDRFVWESHCTQDF